jgi:hypothetical protein
VTISNPDLLSSSETGVNSGIGSLKITYATELSVRKPHLILFDKEVKICDSTTWFRI